MRATAIIRNVSEQFWTGFGDHVKGFDNMTPEEQFHFCSRGDWKNVSLKIGNNSFRDRVDLNELIRKPYTVTVNKLPRRGYMLVEFLFSAVK